ncbi:MAG TPA: plastocyanin/azurin family copper-binding protein [Gaiellaceae bacterium]|jgi:plastocyanin|nr:plastocyanin/azurin family copper-binding protein [Gaiellaceae bacterium]
MKLVLAATALAAALLAPSALGAARLNGTVGPGFTIALTQAGKKVAKLKPGTYTLVVSDRSTIHDFHLQGPGVDKTTTVGFKGTKTWKVTLKKGTYTFQCDPHASFMHGSFRVT